MRIEDAKKSWKECKQEIKKDRFKFLAYIVSTKQLEIKVGVIPNDIEHSKYGIFYDNYDAVISKGITSDTPNAIASTGLILVVSPNNFEFATSYYNIL